MEGGWGGGERPSHCLRRKWVTKWAFWCHTLLGGMGCEDFLGRRHTFIQFSQGLFLKELHYSTIWRQFASLPYKLIVLSIIKQMWGKKEIGLKNLSCMLRLHHLLSPPSGVSTPPKRAGKRGRKELMTSSNFMTRWIKRGRRRYSFERKTQWGFN